MSAQAQGVEFGLKGGLNVNRLAMNGDVFDSSNQMGFFIGPTVKVQLPIGGVGIDVSALYDQRDLEINDMAIIQKTVIIPVNARLGMGLSGFGIYAAVGPQLEFNVGNSEFRWYDAHSYTNTFTMRKSNLSVNLGGGATIGRLEVGIAYNIAIGRTADVDHFDSVLKEVYEHRRAHANSWKLSLAAYF